SPRLSDSSIPSPRQASSMRILNSPEATSRAESSGASPSCLGAQASLLRIAPPWHSHWRELYLLFLIGGSITECGKRRLKWTGSIINSSGRALAHQQLKMLDDIAKTRH